MTEVIPMMGYLVSVPRAYNFHMAQRRMFSAQIVSSDMFLEMPLTSQALYFHLGMSADDDGFVSPRKILRMTGAGDDDLKVLIAKNFAIPLNSGVIVITHWRQNNYLRNDRYTPTIYKEEAGSLSCIQGVYRMDTGGIPKVSSLETQVGRKLGREKEKSFEKNEDRLSQTRLDSYGKNIRAILQGDKRSKTN